MENFLLYFLILIGGFLFIYFVGGAVIIISSALVLFEKCILSRVNLISGVEFTTLSIILVTLKYGWGVGVLFAILVPMLLPAIINSIIGEKYVINQNFVILTVGMGNLVDLSCVFIVYFLRFLDILWIMVLILIFKQTINNVVNRLKTVNFVPDYFGTIMNFIFNVGFVLLFHNIWVSLL